MQRIIIIYNEHSSKAEDVEKEVIRPIQKRGGVLVGKYGIRKTGLMDNAERISKILEDGDEVIVTGGDGTATVAINGVIRSGKKVAMKLLPYGNFNDMARSWKGKEGKKWYPIEVKINGEHFWYVGGYFSVGMFAKSTNEFNGEKRRKKLQEKRGGLGYSIGLLARWYFRHKKEDFLPEGELGGEKWKRGTTDILAINTEKVARVMRTEGYGLERRKFYVSTGRLRSFFRLSIFMMRSMIKSMPGEEVENRTIKFSRPEKISVQMDGEYLVLDGVEKIEVKKSGNFIPLMLK